VVRMQEELGLKLVTDGEYNRFSWQRDFLLKIGNVKNMPSRLTVRFHSAAGARDHSPPSLQVAGKLTRPAGIFVDDFKFLASVAEASVAKPMPKLTIPSPTIVHFRGGREAIDAKAYPQMAAFYDDLAAVYRAEIADLPKTYAKLLNAVVAGKPADMTVCMHLCRGNFAGAWIAEGGYEPVAELLFNEIDVDGYFLEYDTARAGSFAPLRFLPKGKIAVLGLVTTKSPQMETKDELMRRIDEASRYAPLEQLALSPQCGFSSGIGGNAMTVDDEIAKLKLVVETALEVWGAA